MIAQQYVGKGEIRIFDRYNILIAVVPLGRTVDDNALKRLRIKRREKWRETDWGYEAKIRFI